MDCDIYNFLYAFIGYFQEEDGQTGTKIKKIQDLFDAVSDVGNWCGLCSNLYVDDGVMDRLEHSNDLPEKKKRDCLRAFYDSGDATWEQVVKGVAKSPINNKKLANEIAWKYIVHKDE